MFYKSAVETWCLLCALARPSTFMFYKSAVETSAVERLNCVASHSFERMSFDSL